MNAGVNPSGEGSEGEQPADAGLTVDEKFAKLAAEFDGTRVQGPGAKEEAARTRELRAKWSRNPPQPQPWRSDGPRQSPFYPTPPQDPRGTKKSARDRARGSVKVLVGLGLMALIAYGFWPKHHAPAPVNASPAGTAQPWTVDSAAAASPSVSASPSPTFTNPDDNYFVGSPALTWANNEAGFVLPKATSMHGVSSGDIAAGYQLLEKLMEAGNLDATILNGGSVSDFTNLLDPSNTTRSKLTSWIGSPRYRHDPTELVTRFNPANTRLLGHTVKVYGSMSAAPGDDYHSVYLTADYVFAYAVGPASGTAAEDTRTTVHRTLEIEVVNPNYFQNTSGKAWVMNFAVSTGNIKCYVYDGYVEPGFDGSGATPDSTATMDPYATGNQLTASAAPTPTSTQGDCESGTT